MTLTEADVRAALEVLDVMSGDQVDALRTMVAALDARVRAEAGSACVGATGVPPEPAWTPVAAAMLFVIWVTTEASLARSL